MLYDAAFISSPNIARTQDSRLIFLNFDAELWNSIAFVPTHLDLANISAYWVEMLEL